MPAPRDLESSRRSVVPQAAGRSLWFAAIWTGVGAAVVCATAAIVVVAICWIPVSGTSGHTSSAIRAGLLTFLAALHGGITVDGTEAQFIPLGMTILVGLIAWRAGSGLGDAAEAMGEFDPVRLAVAGAAQVASFVACCLLIVPFSTLGSSSAPFLGVAAAALVLCTLTAGTAFARSSALRESITSRSGMLRGPVLRAGVAIVSTYLGVGAVLCAASLAVHHARAEAISHAVGGGWSGVPILLLGILAAPNAAIAGASYLAGPGFAVGAGASATPFATAHGLLPAFPVLAAVPDGHGATAVVWWLIAATPLIAGCVAARALCRIDGWAARLLGAVLAAACAGLVMLVLAWQGGGGVGDGGLAAVGASPWQLGGAVAVASLLASLVMLSLIAAWSWLDTSDSPLLADLFAARADDDADDDADGDVDEDVADAPSTKRARVPATVARATAGDGDDDPDGQGELAG